MTSTSINICMWRFLCRGTKLHGSPCLRGQLKGCRKTLSVGGNHDGSSACTYSPKMDVTGARRGLFTRWMRVSTTGGRSKEQHASWRTAEWEPCDVQLRGN